MNGNKTWKIAEPASTPTQGPPDVSNRILLVDDDTSIRSLSAHVLTTSGYQVDTAEDGAGGWEALHASNYDLLITDHNMPKVTGVELVRKLRSARMTLPVVLTTGTVPAEALSRPSLRLAATLLKPFTMEELLQTVERVLRAAAGVSGRAVYSPATTAALPGPQI